MNARDLSWLWRLALSQFASAVGRCTAQCSCLRPIHSAPNSAPNIPAYRSQIPAVDLHYPRTRLALLAFLACSPALAAVDEASEKAGIVECSPALLEKHNPALAGKPDTLVCFEAYVSNFNTARVAGGRDH